LSKVISFSRRLKASISRRTRVLEAQNLKWGRVEAYCAYRFAWTLIELGQLEEANY